MKIFRSNHLLVATTSGLFALGAAAEAKAATPTYFDNEAALFAVIGQSVTDDYSNPNYQFIQNNAAMSAVLGETDYQSTGHQNLNIVQGSDTYCAGCNGSFQLSFLTTSVGDNQGVLAVGVKVVSNSQQLPYFAFVTFADGTTDNIALPATGYFGVTAPERIATIHFGLTMGGTTQSGSFVIDDLTVGDLAGFCGDGTVDDGEECDDGNDVETDECTSECALAACGDGLIQEGVDECDDGNDVDTDECTNLCTLAACGDGIVQEGVENCDDGNDVDDDECSNACVMASCGDGVVQAGEACDDGNDVDDDGCSNACMSPSCGDGIVQAGEECDDPEDPMCVDCALVGESTTGTTGDETSTTGDETSTTGGTSGGSTGTGGDETTGTNGDSSTSTGDTGATSGAVDTDGGVSEDGCGCSSGEGRGGGLLGLSLLALLGLRRRPRR